MQRWATTDQIIWELCLDLADAGSIKYKGERLSFSGHIKVVGYEKTFGRSLWVEFNANEIDLDGSQVLIQWGGCCQKI